MVGALSGFINGFFGMGGGIIALFALQNQVEDKRKANATCLAIILPMAVVSLIVYTFSSSVDFKLSFQVVIGAVVGAVVGAKLLAKVKYKWILWGYTGLMVFSGIMMIFRKG